MTDVLAGTKRPSTRDPRPEDLLRESAGQADVSERTFVVCLGALVAIGLATRLLGLGRVYLWIDETPILTETLWRDHGGGVAGLLRGMRALGMEVYGRQTDNGTWAALVYGVCRTVGTPTAWWARLPSVLAAVAMLPVLALLTRRVSGSRLAGLIAAGAALTSVAQTHYAQQALPYGPAVLAAALVAWAAAAWHGKLLQPESPDSALPAGFLFFVAVAAAVGLHPCGLPVSVGCILVLAVTISWLWRKRHVTGAGAARHLAALSQAALIVAAGALVFVLPKLDTGFRSYLGAYYAPTEGAPRAEQLPALAGFAVSRAYDLVAYALNPAYADSLYRPLALNPVCLTGAALVLAGAVSLWRRNGPARTLVLAGLASSLTVLAGALVQRYPFGGVRQCLPVTPFIYAFLGAGAWWLYRCIRPAAVALAPAWLALWLAFLPGFYSHRLSPYDGDVLASAAVSNGVRLIVTVNEFGCPEDAVLRYYLRGRSEPVVSALTPALAELQERREPFLIASVTKSLGKLLAPPAEGAPIARERRALADLLAEPGLTVTPIAEVALNPVRPDAMQEDGQSIYTPLNGLFLYGVSWNGPLHIVQDQGKLSSNASIGWNTDR